MDELYSLILKEAALKHIDKEAAIRMITTLRQAQEPAAKDRREDIAIIGMSSHIAGTQSFDEFWSHIEAGIDLTGAFPTERQAGVDDYLTNKLQGSDWELKYVPGAYLHDIESFDYGFFRITPKEAQLMDPSQRLFLQTAWEAIDDAGYGGKKLIGSKTGVYVGYSSNSNYHMMIFEQEPASAPSALTGNIAAMLPSRIAYLLDLKGPTLILDTACSSSSVAIHLACAAIHQGDCQMAIAGGIRINLLPFDNPGLKLGVEALDGRTRTFDAQAEGAGWGEGSAAIILKPLSKAVSDGDHIYAVIKGSAVNQDGTSIGITAPSSAAQDEVLTQAWNNAGIDPATIGYIEAHGTATSLGDPLEIEGLQRAFRRYTNKKQFCAISTVKTNVGHTYECAGIAGVIKAAMSLKHKKLPASAHFNMPNKTIDFSQSPVYVNTRTRHWEEADHPRRCGVSAFGLSGTNCHIVLEEYIPKQLVNDEHSSLPNIFALSAKSTASLQAMIVRYAEFVNEEQEIQLRDLCYTVNTGRGQYSHRIALIVENMDDLKIKLGLLAQQPIEAVELDGIRFGIHKVVSGNKQQLGEHDMKESLRVELSRTAKQQLEQFCLDGKDDMKALLDISELYTRGAEVSWERLYEGEARCKLHAPAYVFEKNRCWLTTPERVVDVQESLFYSMEWIRDDRQLQPSSNQGAVVVFKDDSGYGDAIVECLRSSQRQVIEVELADTPRYETVEGDRYQIDGSKEGYMKLMRQLKDMPISITQMIHLFTLDDGVAVGDLQSLQMRQRRGGYSLFYFTQALAHTDMQQDIDFMMVSQHAMEVTGSEQLLIPDHAPLYGIGKVISKEHPNVKCRWMDIDHATDVKVILAEIQSVNEQYAVAYRGNVRYMEVFSELSADKLETNEVNIRAEGVYVITGGTGGVGLEMAKWLVAKSKSNVNVALLSRNPIPPRAQWEAELSGRGAEKLKKKLRALQQLEALGANIKCISVDVSDLVGMEQVIAELKSKYGKINGIIHGAGISSDGPLVHRSDELFDAIYAPKVYGTWVLDSLTQAENMDFFIMFSSVATMFSATGQAEYAAANAYMDAYAAYRHKMGKRTLTINWTTWKETGMAYESGHVMDTIFKSLPTAEGLEAFESLLQSDTKRALIGEVNYDGVGALLLERSGITCSEPIMQRIAARKEKERKRKAEHVVKTEQQSDGDVLRGRDHGDYSQLERELALCCKTVFGFDHMDVYDNFFEMGADSLLLMKLQSEIEASTYESLSISELFEYTSISQLSEFLESRRGEGGRHRNSSIKYPELQIAPAKPWYPTSYAQKRMFLANKREPYSTSSNQYRVSVIETRMEPKRLEHAARQMIDRHEVLRTSITNMDEEIIQHIRERVDFELAYWEADEHSAEDIIRSFIQPFVLNAPPLFRLGLLKISDELYYLLYDAHHSITDGVSMEIFMRELIQLYKGEAIPAPKYQYKDYVEWQQQCMSMDFMNNQEAYWVNVFADGIPVLQLPTDYERDEYYSFEGSVITQYMDSERTEKLRQQVKATGSTLYIVLLAAYSILLSRYAAQEDIVIGSPVLGRPKRELDKILGMFINMVAMRVKPRKELTFSDYLDQVKQDATQVFDHQDYPFEELINRLNVKRSVNRHPLFDTVFVFQNATINDPANAHPNGRTFEDVYNLTDYDLTLEALERDGKLQLRLEYSTKLFTRETAERIVHDYLSVLEAVTEQMDIQIQDIELSTSHDIVPDYVMIEDVSFNF